MKAAVLIPEAGFGTNGAAGAGMFNPIARDAVVSRPYTP